MAEGDDTQNKAWGSEEIKRFLKKLGLPMTGEAMKFAFAIDFAMRRGNRAEAQAVALDLAALDPHVDAQTMADMAMNQYQELDRAFRNGEFDNAPDVEDDEEDGELATDYTDEMYRGMLRVMGAPTTDDYVELARKMTHAREAGDMQKAKFWAKAITNMIATSGGSNLLNDENPSDLTLNMDLDPEEMVRRILEASEYITEDFLNTVAGGDMGNYEDEFHDTRNDPAYDPNTGGIDMTLKEQEDAAAAAELRQIADALRDQAAAKLGIPDKFKNDVADLIRYAVEQRYNRLRDRATAIATAIATEEANGGPVDEDRINALLANLTNTALAAGDEWIVRTDPERQNGDQPAENAQPNPAPAAEQNKPKPKPKPKRKQAGPTLNPDHLQLTIDKMIEFLKTGDKREAMEIALDQAHEMRQAGLSSKSAADIAKSIMAKAMETHRKRAKREQQFEEAQVERQRQIDENAARARNENTADAGATSSPAAMQPDDLKATMKKMIEALKKGDKKGAMAIAVQQAQAMRAAKQSSKSAQEIAKSLFVSAQEKAAEHIRRAAMLEQAEAERQTQIAEGEAADARVSTNTLDRIAQENALEDAPEEGEGPEGLMPDTGIELTLRHSASTDWLRVSTLYGFDPEDAQELESIGSLMVKKGPEDGTAKRLAKSLHERGKKKKKKPKVKNHKHLLAAILDAIRRKANKKKVSKPLKPGDVPDGDQDQNAAA